MANRIIVTDGDWSADTIRLVPRAALPQVVSGLAAGEWLLSNTGTSPGAISVSQSATGDPAVALTDDGHFAVDNIDPADTSYTLPPITEPARYAGTYSFNPSLLLTRPDCLVMPPVETEGDDLVGDQGLWIHDEDAAPFELAFQWERDEVAIPGATTLRYADALTTPANYGTALRLAVTGTDGHGPHTEYSDPVAVTAPVVLESDFTGTADGTLLTAHTDASGRTFSGTGTTAVARIEGGHITSFGSGSISFYPSSDDVSDGTYKATFTVRTALTRSGATEERGAMAAFGIKDATNGFYVANEWNNNFQIYKVVNGVVSAKSVAGPLLAADTEYLLEITINGNVCSVSVNGAARSGLGFTDDDLIGGDLGVAARPVSSDTTGVGRSKIKLVKVENI